MARSNGVRTVVVADDRTETRESMSLWLRRAGFDVLEASDSSELLEHLADKADVVVLDALRKRGVATASVTLHVGPGTFRPVATEDPRAHVLDPEPYRVPPESAAAIRSARERMGRVLAVGTTAVRTLESWAREGSPDDGAWRETGLFIVPPFEFQVVEGMITNFHLPRSSLLFLVSALAGPDDLGRKRVLAAYEEAVRERYRFYSYGDAMLIA